MPVFVVPGCTGVVTVIAAASPFLCAAPAAVPSDPRVLKNAAVLAKRNVDSRRKKGIITDADGDVSFTHRMDALGRGVVMDLRHNGDTQFVESWVADVHVVRPVNALLGAYLSAGEGVTALAVVSCVVLMALVLHWTAG